MKRVHILGALFMFLGTFLTAQEIANHALGLRLGDSDGFGAEVSYQKRTAVDNRLEFNLGWRDSRNFNAIKLAGLYQWVQTLDENFNWYYGAGGGLGSVNFPNIPNNEDIGGVFIFGAGNIGLEYNFDLPLILSLDFRPEIGIAGYGDFSNNFDFDIGLGIRYQF